MKKTTKALLLFLTLGSVATGLNSCSKKDAAMAKTDKQETITVQTAQVETAQMAATLKVTGALEGTREATIQSETQGRVLSIIKSIGDRVGQGSPLVKVDDELKAIALQQATAQRLSAEAALEKAKIDASRSEQLLKDNAIPKSQLELADLQVKSADAMLKGALSAESMAKRQLSDATIKAPFAGVISNRFVNQGETLSPNAHVETIVDDSKMKFKMFVNELEVANLKVHDKVNVTVDAVPGKEFVGTVSNISDKADQTHSYEVDVEIPNSDRSLKSGMFARGEVLREAIHDVPSVPNEAIIYAAGTTQCYVVENNVAHLRSIKIGSVTPQRVEIIDGLKRGEEVVTFGQNLLHEGVRVRK